MAFEAIGPRCVYSAANPENATTVLFNPAAGVVTPTSVSEKVEVPLAIPEGITVGARHQLTDTVTLLAGTLIFDGNGKVDERNYQHENPSQVAQLPTGTEDPSNYRGEYELDAWSVSCGRNRPVAAPDAPL